MTRLTHLALIVLIAVLLVACRPSGGGSGQPAASPAAGSPAPTLGGY